MDTKGGKRLGGGGGGVMNWEIGIDMYTLMCIKWITNKNLLYKKINKTKFKKKEKIYIYTECISCVHHCSKHSGYGSGYTDKKLCFQIFYILVRYIKWICLS